MKLFGNNVQKSFQLFKWFTGSKTNWEVIKCVSLPTFQRITEIHSVPRSTTCFLYLAAAGLVFPLFPLMSSKEKSDFSAEEWKAVLWRNSSAVSVLTKWHTRIWYIYIKQMTKKLTFWAFALCKGPYSTCLLPNSSFSTEGELIQIRLVWIFKVEKKESTFKLNKR